MTEPLLPMRWRSADLWLFLLACLCLAAALTVGPRYGPAVEAALTAAATVAAVAALRARRWGPKP